MHRNVLSQACSVLGAAMSVIYPLRSRDQCHRFVFRLGHPFFCVRRQYLLQMSPFDLDLLAITMTCSPSLIFFPGITESVSDVWLFYFFVSYFPFRFLSKEQRYKTSYFSHSALCFVSSFSFLGTPSIQNELFTAILFHSFPLHQVTYIFPSVRPLIFFSISVVNSNYRGLCAPWHTQLNITRFPVWDSLTIRFLALPQFVESNTAS